MKSILFSFLSAVLLAAPALAGSGAAKEPVYIYLYARVTDHVNLDITEDRLRRLLPLIERYRRENSDAHMSATILFSGAVSEALAQRNRESHIVDFVKGYVRRGVIEAGYDGSDEPTYVNRPAVDFTQIPNAQDRWLARLAAEEKFLNEGRDPLTGALRPGTAGGLKEMQQVFGSPACITGLTLPMKMGPGLFNVSVTRADRAAETASPREPIVPGTLPEIGADTEAIIDLRHDVSRAIMFGVTDTNPARIPGFREGRAGFSRLMSPLPETPPELYWQDNVLRSSEASDDTVRLVHADNGLEPMKKLVATADRTRVHVVHVELASEQDYLQPEFVKGPEFPALKYAYDHPDAPRLPSNALRSKSDIDGAFAREDALLKWTVEEFIPADSGSRFVSSTDLRRMAGPSTGFRISVNELRSAAGDFLKLWGNDTFAPALFRVEGRYLSRAELFQVLADCLAEFHLTGKFPDSVEVIPVYGPIRVLTGHGPNVGETSVESVARISAEIAPGLHDQSAGPIPKNALPIAVTVEGAMLNPAQFLRLMAMALVNPSPEAKLNIRMEYEFTGVGQLMPRTRPDMDDGFIWTLKPAPIEVKTDTRAN